MDNFKLDVTSEGDETLKTVLALFRKKMAGYREDTTGNRLILYWVASEKSVKLPFQMELDQAASFVSGWLKQADYGTEPDLDGDVGRGWRIYCESWGHVGGEWQAYAAIEPVWALYGK